MNSQYDELNDAETLQTLVDEHDSAADIADEIGCHPPTVRDWIVHHDINHDYRVNDESDIPELNDTDWMTEQVSEHNNSRKDIADELGVSQMLVNRWFIRHGVEATATPSHKTETDSSFDPETDESPAWARTGRPWQDPENLRVAYWDYYWSTQEIADWVADDVNSSMILAEMRRKDIPVRDNDVATRVAKLRQRGLPLDEIKRRCPPPWADEPTDVTAEPVEWSKLASDD